MSAILIRREHAHNQTGEILYTYLVYYALRISTCRIGVVFKLFTHLAFYLLPMATARTCC